MTLTTINQLTESKLFRHPRVLKNLGEDGIKDLTFLYILVLYVLYNEPETHEKAVLYAKRTKSYRDFKEFYIGGTDLYLLINTLISSNNKEWSNKWPFSIKTNPALIKKPLLLMFFDRLANANIERNFVHTFLLQLQNSLKINNGSLRSIRRYIQDWHLLGHSRKKQIMLKIVSFIKTKTMHIEIYKDVMDINRKYNINDK